MIAQEPRLGVSIKYESRTIFRNVRPVAEIIAEFEEKQIPHVPIDPSEMKYGNWDIVVAFEQDDLCEQFKSGQITMTADWLASSQGQKLKINPLKASKRAHAKK